MNLLSDILTYIRRIIKSPSDTDITDNLLIDYVNRFWIYDVDARMQLFDLKTLYRFQTTPGIDQYNMPLYSIQTEPGSQSIASYPVYQGFMGPCSVNGVPVPFYTERNAFWNYYPNYIQPLNQAASGDGGASYTLNLPYFPAIPGHVDMAGIIATGSTQDPIFGTTLNTSVPVTSVYSGVYFTATGPDGQNIVVCDSGQFLANTTDGQLYGLLMNPGNPPLGNSSLGTYSTTSNTINYATGVANVTFPVNIPSGTPINVQCYFYNQGQPRGILYYNNVITVRPPPNISYLVELEAYLSPAAFLSTGAAIPFGYMSEYIARGAARKILSDTGDQEQLMFYEPFFREQEQLVWKRSQRQFTSTRTQTLFSQGVGAGGLGIGYGSGNN